MTSRPKRQVALQMGVMLVAVLATANATTTNQVVLSEIAWMGTTTSASNEWVELYNNTAYPINLNGWTLRAADGTPSITLTGTIPARGYYLLERTDDTSVPDRVADQIYTGALGNSGEVLVLTDLSGTIQDQTATVWPAGDVASKATMTRVAMLGDGTLASSWATASTIYSGGLGTPNDIASSPTAPAVTEDFVYDVKFAGGLTGSTVIEPASQPAATSVLPMATAVLNQINAATHSIEFAVYGFRNQCAFKDALVAAQARGVVVRGVVDQQTDGTYEYHDTAGCDTQAVITALGNDINGLPWVHPDINPGTGKGYGAIMHNKFWIIDGEWISTGSTNYSDTGIGGEFNANWNMILRSVNLAQVYDTEFVEMWLGKFHKSKTDNTFHVLPTYRDGTVIESYFAPTDDATIHAIIPAINTSNTSLDIAIFYLTSQPITDAILAAKGRGSNVRVIIDSTGAGNAYSTHPQLCAAGIPVKVENWNGKMHMKALNADNSNIIIGSQNWTDAGNSDNDENTLWIKGSGATSVSVDYNTYYNNLWTAITDQYICNNPGAEGIGVGNTCSDGIDNDYDGLIDGADPNCH